MEASSLRNFALDYLHFFRSSIDGGYYQPAVIILFLLACGGAIWLALRKPKSWFSHPAIYAFLLLLSVVWSRIPWLVAWEMNVDESMFLASARKLVFDPVFFRSVDGGTSGPLNYYALLLPWFVGLPFDYATVHLMNGLCLGAALVCLYGIARKAMPEVSARVSVLPLLGAIMTFAHHDLLHYTSECASLVLIAIASLLLLTDSKPWKMVTIGVIVVLMPFAKLQSAPCAAVLGVTALVVAAKRSKFQALQVLIGAGATLVGVVLLLAFFGQLGECYFTYIQYNFAYANHHRDWGAGDLRNFFLTTREIPILLLIAVVSMLFALFGRRSFTWRHGFALALFVAGAYSAYRPMRPFTHYWLYTVFPAGLMITLGFESQMKSARRSAALLGVALILPLFWTLRLGRDDIAQLAQAPAKLECTVCDTIAVFAKPGDFVSVWGWTPYIYVRTGTIHSSRESFTERQTTPWVQQPHFLERYVNDLNQYMPRVFVDAATSLIFPGFQRELYGHEAYPALKALIDSNFRFLAEIDGYRVYIRKDL